MDRTEECVCCHEVPEVMNENEEVFETDKLKEKPSCITENPASKSPRTMLLVKKYDLHPCF